MYAEQIFIQQASIFECKQDKIRIHGNNYQNTTKRDSSRSYIEQIAPANNCNNSF